MQHINIGLSANTDNTDPQHSAVESQQKSTFNDNKILHRKQQTNAKTPKDKSNNKI